jgi:hypothetical protein
MWRGWSILMRTRLILCDVILLFLGYLNPSLSSAKAIISKDVDSITEWLTYWSVFSCFMLLETITDFFLWYVNTNS